MRVAFDETIFAAQTAGGVSRYFVEVAKQLRHMSGISLQVVAPLYINLYLAEAGVRPLGVAAQRLLRRVPPGVGTINRLMARPILRALAPDIVHETYYRPDRGALPGRPTVLTVYDMIHEKFAAEMSDSASVSRLKRAAVDRADRVICISEQTRRDLIELFGVPPEKTAVTYLASCMGGGLLKDLPRRTGPDFLLYVGKRSGYKNFEALVRAWAQVRSRFDVRLIAFGGGAFTGQELAMMRNAGMSEDDVEHRQGDDTTLEGLYREAIALIYPSRYEGFGIPPLEAMSVGCPVVCASVGSLPEVVGDAAQLFDPEQPDSLGAAISQLLDDSSARADFRARGLRRAGLFSWRRCAEETLAVYRTMVAA